MDGIDKTSKLRIHGVRQTPRSGSGEISPIEFQYTDRIFIPSGCSSEVRLAGNGNQHILLDNEDMNMTRFDFSPLYRTTVGFDHLSSLLDTVTRNDNAGSGYPPYNIELLDKDSYRISMAVAGFSEDDITIQVESEELTIRGRKSEDQEERKYLHQGIGARSFERHFRLADHVRVNGAQLENGLLHIDLVREVPEAMKPRTIPIGSENMLGGKARLKQAG